MHLKKITFFALFFFTLWAFATEKEQSTTIAFALYELSFRGIEVSTYDYAHFNETLLGNRSIIINFDTKTDNEVRKKFATRFAGRFFDCVSREDMDFILAQERADILYIQKPGHNDGILSQVAKNAMHAVFPQKLEKHGDVYAFISPWFEQQFPQMGCPTVPLIVWAEHTDTNLRAQLGIPPDALVFGRYGGFESFNVPCALEAIKEVARARPDIYFLFLNTKEFCNLPNVIFLPKTTDMIKKSAFVNTCDAMIHGRWRGETFGLACGEFSIKNKPVITWAGPKERAHITILGSKGTYYNSKEELIAILLNFKRQPEKNWDAYSKDFCPQVIMKRFDQVFIKPLIASGRAQQRVRIPFMYSHEGTHVSPDFLRQLETMFGCTSATDAPQKKKGQHHERPLIVLRAKGGQSNMAEQFQLLAGSGVSGVFVIDDPFTLEAGLLAQLYQTCSARGYRLLLIDNALVIFPGQEYSIDPLIQAMTTSWLCQVDAFAQQKTINDLISSEQYIGRTWQSKQLSRELQPLKLGTHYQHLWQALAYLHEKNYKKAAELFDGLIAAGFNHWRMYWYLGSALYQLGDIRAEDAMMVVNRSVPQFSGITEFKRDISY